jgi:hypothetical protein
VADHEEPVVRRDSRVQPLPIQLPRHHLGRRQPRRGGGSA